MGFRNRLNFPPGSITAAMLADGSVTGPKLSFDAIDGKTITGAHIRTDAPPNTRWEMDSVSFTNRLLAYSGNVNEAAPGGLVALNGNAEVQLLQPRLSTTAVAAILSLHNVDPATTTADLWSNIGSLVNPATGTAALTWDTNAGLWYRDTAWTVATPLLVNSWVDVAGSRVRYLRDAAGNVHLGGTVSGGSAVLIFTLPVGYRPTQSREFAFRGSSGTGVLTIVGVATNGQVTVLTNLVSAQTRMPLDLVFSAI